MSKKTVLGIDIGYDQLKLAQVTDGVVDSTALVQMPENLFKEGRLVSPEIMSSLIRETMKEQGMKASRAAVVLPNETVYVKNVDMPMMTEDQLTYNLPFEFNDYITGEIQDYLFDYAVLTPEEDPISLAEAIEREQAEGEEALEAEDDTLHLMAVGVEKSIVEETQSMLRKASLRLVKTAPALCTYISLIRQQREALRQISDEYGILDLGYHAITMYMYKNDRHVATREFETGLNALDDIVADKFGVEKHLAHTYVLSDFENCLQAEECVNFYDNIAVELMRAINFYEFSNQGSSLNDLWICGGGAVNVPLLRSIYDTLEVQMHRASDLIPGGADIEHANSLVQAIGVTLEI